jgi:hypothetical protein
VEPARDFAQLHLHFVDQIQWRYELIRPLVLLEEGTATQRAQDTHTHPDTVRTFVRRFRQQGMLGLLSADIEVAPRGRASRVPEAVRQELARLKALYTGFQYRELVRIVFCTTGYRLAVHTIKKLVSGFGGSRPSTLLGSWTRVGHPRRQRARSGCR